MADVQLDKLYAIINQEMISAKLADNEQQAKCTAKERFNNIPQKLRAKLVQCIINAVNKYLDVSFLVVRKYSFSCHVTDTNGFLLCTTRIYDSSNVYSIAGDIISLLVSGNKIQQFSKVFGLFSKVSDHINVISKTSKAYLDRSKLNFSRNFVLGYTSYAHSNNRLDRFIEIFSKYQETLIHRLPMDYYEYEIQLSQLVIPVIKHKNTVYGRVNTEWFNLAEDIEVDDDTCKILESKLSLIGE